jgi:serine/threonine protein kinase
VFLDEDHHARLGDFGLAITTDYARLSTMAASISHEPGKMVGTVLYMPPEQARGEQATERSDLYSLGAMLYETVTGRPPFMGDNLVTIIQQQINDQPVPPRNLVPEVPAALDDLILKMLAKSADERPQSAKIVLEQLEDISDGLR